MAERIGYEFTVEDRRLLESLSRFSSGLDELRADAKKLSVDTNKAFRDITKGINDAEKKSSGFKNVFGGIIAADLVRNGVRALRQVGQAAIGAAANYEQLQVAFTTFLGSADKADKLLKELTETAATTPFQQEEIYQAARQLLAFGIEQERVNGLIRDLGDISSGIGQPLSRLTLIFGQIQAKGKLAGQELLQLREAGVNPMEELATVTGHAAHEIEDLVSKGKITADHVAAAFKIMTSEGGRFNNLMEKQSETFEGLTSNFRDQISILLRDFGTQLLPVLKEGIQNLLQFLKTLDPEKVRAFGQNVASFISILGTLVKQLPFLIAGYLAYQVAVNYAAIATKALTVAQKAFNTASKANPIGLFLGVVLALGPQLLTLARRLNGVTKVQDEMREKLKQLRIEFGDETRAVNENIKIMGDLGVTTKQRQAAFDDLSSKYPDILAKYDREKISLRDLITLQDELTQSISDRIVKQAEADVDQELFEKLLDIQESTPSIASIRGKRLNGFVEDTKHALRDADDFKRQLQDKLRKEESDKAKEEADEKKRLIRETGKVFDDVNTENAIRGGRNFGTLQQAQNSLNKEKEREVGIQGELSKLSSSELRILANSQETEAKRQAIAKEILKAREAEARANAGNKKEIEKAAKAMEKYRDAVQKVAENIEKAGIDQITDPFKKLQAEQRLALDQIELLFDELRTEARKVGADITELEKLETEARAQAQVEYYKKLEELRKENRDKAFADFQSQSQLLTGQQVDEVTRSTTAGDGLTRDENLRVNILAAEVDELERLRNRAQELFGRDSDEQIQAQLDLNEKMRELTETHVANREAIVDRQEAALLAEVDLIKKSGDVTLSLEEFKEQKKLEIQLEFAQKRLELARALPGGADSPEVKELEQTVAAYNHALEQIGEGNIIDKIKAKIAKIFDIDVSVLNESIQLFGQAFGQISDIVADNTQFQIEQNQEILDGIRDRIDETEDLLNQEIEDQREGYAANVDSKREELEALKQQEKIHKDEQARLEKQALKQKLVQDSLSQVSSLITMVANVVATEGKKGLLGVATGLAAIALFFGLFKSFKNQAKGLASQALFKGGRIPKEGFTDVNGGRGHRIEGTDMRVGAGEYVINAKSSDMNAEFLKRFNKGDFDKVKLNDLLKGPERIKPIILGRDLGERVDKQKRADIEARHQYEHKTRVEVMGQIFGKEIDRLIKAMDDKEESMPWTEGQIGIIKKKKGRTIKQRFS